MMDYVGRVTKRRIMQFALKKGNIQAAEVADVNGATKEMRYVTNLNYTI
jgi:hypothetical protein